MVLISGTSLTLAELPNGEMVEYQIENDVSRMGIKLKTSAKSHTCFKIFISEEYRTEYTITEELAEKLFYFENDEDLIRLLNEEEKKTDNSYDDPFAETPVETPVEIPEFEKPLPLVFLDKKEPIEETPTEPEIADNMGVNENADVATPVVQIDKSELFDIPKITVSKPDVNSFIPEIDLEMANTELPESLLVIPNIHDDVDSLKLLLKTKDGIISQKDGVIQDLKNKIEESYKLQEMQLLEVETLYKQKMMECQTLITELEQRGQGITLDEETSNFLKFINYARNPKAIVKEGFTPDEVNKMGTLRSKYTIFACGSGESDEKMLRQVKKYIDSGKDCLVLDFCNDNFLASIFKLNSKSKNTLGLFRDDVNPLSLLTEISNTKFVATTSFNDIALLSANWGETLRKIDDLAGGKDVIMIFGSVTNFNVRHTISKLATIGKLYIFAKCSPIVLSALFSNAQFLPKNRVRIVALEYIEVVKTILSELSKYYEIFAFAGDVEWNKLDLK